MPGNEFRNTTLKTESTIVLPAPGSIPSICRYSSDPSFRYPTLLLVFLLKQRSRHPVVNLPASFPFESDILRPF